MATWTSTAKSAWASGMKSEKSNGLNSSEQVALLQKVNAWADGTQKGTTISDETFVKAFSVGKVNGAPWIVSVSCKRAEINAVAFKKQ